MNLSAFFSPTPQPEMPAGRPCVVQRWAVGPNGGAEDWRSCGKATTHPAPTVLDFPICDECLKELRDR